MEGDLVARLLREWGGSPGWLDPTAEATYRSAARVPFAAHSQMEQLRWMVRSMPRPDGRRYHATLEASTRPVPVLQVHGGRDGLRPASRAALSKDTAALVGLALPVRAAAPGRALPRGGGAGPRDATCS